MAEVVDAARPRGATSAVDTASHACPRATDLAERALLADTTIRRVYTDPSRGDITDLTPPAIRIDSTPHRRGDTDRALTDLTAGAIIIPSASLRGDTETKLTDEAPRAVIISLTDLGGGGDARARDTRLERTALDIILAAAGDLADVVDTPRARDEAVSIVSTEEAGDTASRGTALLGSAVFINAT